MQTEVRAPPFLHLTLLAPGRLRERAGAAAINSPCMRFEPVGAFEISGPGRPQAATTRVPGPARRTEGSPSTELEMGASS